MATLDFDELSRVVAVVWGFQAIPIANRGAGTMKCAWLFLLITGAASCCDHSPGPAPSQQQSTTRIASIRSVKTSELSNESVWVIGPLDQPLGKLVFISGRAVPMAERSDYWSVNIAKNLFGVTEVNDVRLPKPVWIQLTMPADQKLPEGIQMTYRGYQDGGFIHPPDGVPGMRQFSRFFEVWFHVIESPPEQLTTITRRP